MSKITVRIIAAAILSIAIGSTAFADEFELDKIREDLAELNHEWAENGWNNSVFGEDSDLSAILEKYDYLAANRELVDFVKVRFDAETDPVEKQRLRLLYWDISSTYLFDRTAFVYDELDNCQANDHLWLSFSDEPLSYRDIYPYLREQTDNDIRKELYYADVNYTINTLVPIHRERMDLERELYPEIGYDSAADYYYGVIGVDREKHRKLAYDLLDGSYDTFAKVLEHRCESYFGVGVDEVEPWNRGLMYYATEYDKYFPKEKLVSFTNEYFAGMGFDIASYDNILLDVEDRPEKEPRAATYIVSVPDDIRVNLKPFGGIGDYMTSLHEFGHALHFAETDASLPYEFRHLGTNAVTETYAFLFGRMFLNSDFLIEEFGMPEDEVDEYLNYTLLSEMGGAMYYAILVIYEEKLHDGTLNDEEALAFYADLRSKYSVFPRTLLNNELGYLTVDEEFYSIDYMTAWYAEAQLRNKLEEQFGDHWYQEPAAGEMLKELFVLGDSVTIDEMLRKIGYEDGLDSSYLVKDFEEMYERFERTAK